MNAIHERAPERERDGQAMPDRSGVTPGDGMFVHRAVRPTADIYRHPEPEDIRAALLSAAGDVSSVFPEEVRDREWGMYAYDPQAAMPWPEPEPSPPALQALSEAGGQLAFNFGRVFTLREVGERLGISLRQVEMHVADGTLAAVNVGRGDFRRDLRVLDDDLDRFVEARRLSGPTVAARGPAPRSRTFRNTEAPLTGAFIEERRARAAKGRA